MTRISPVWVCLSTRSICILMGCPSISQLMSFPMSSSTSMMRHPSAASCACSVASLCSLEVAMSACMRMARLGLAP